MIDIVREQYGPEHAEAVRKKLSEPEEERERLERTSGNKSEL
jgi:hypothetical protein